MVALRLVLVLAFVAPQWVVIFARESEVPPLPVRPGHPPDPFGGGGGNCPPLPRKVTKLEQLARRRCSWGDHGMCVFSRLVSHKCRRADAIEKDGDFTSHTTQRYCRQAGNQSK